MITAKFVCQFVVGTPAATYTYSAAQASSVLWLEGEILRQPSAEGNILLPSRTDPVCTKDSESVVEKVVHCW